MKIINYENPEIVYLKDSTAASISTGSNSSACQDNLSFSLRSIPVPIEFLIQPAQRQLDEYAIIAKIDRERIKKAYPKPSLAKPPAIGQDLDIM